MLQNGHSLAHVAAPVKEDAYFASCWCQRASDLELSCNLAGTCTSNAARHNIGAHDLHMHAW
jgi:hypothetical protein